MIQNLNIRSRRTVVCFRLSITLQQIKVRSSRTSKSPSDHHSESFSFRAYLKLISISFLFRVLKIHSFPLPDSGVMVSRGSALHLVLGWPEAWGMRHVRQIGPGGLVRGFPEIALFRALPKLNFLFHLILHPICMHSDSYCSVCRAI